MRIEASKIVIGLDAESTDIRQRDVGYFGENLGDARDGDEIEPEFVQRPGLRRISSTFACLARLPNRSANGRAFAIPLEKAEAEAFQRNTCAWPLEITTKSFSETNDRAAS